MFYILCLNQFLRPGKKNCVFPLTSLKNLGSVGRDFILFCFFIFFLPISDMELWYTECCLVLIIIIQTMVKCKRIWGRPHKGSCCTGPEVPKTVKAMPVIRTSKLRFQLVRKKKSRKGLEKQFMLKFFSNIGLDCVNDPKNELLVKSYYDLIGYTSLWVQ